jgi:hypothetical protein
MTTRGRPLYQAGLTEHLMFAALLIPTFVIIAAAAVSIKTPEPSAAVATLETLGVCEPCIWDNGNEGP